MRSNTWWRVLLAVVAVTFVVWTVATTDSGQDRGPEASDVASTTAPSSAASDVVKGLPVEVGQTLALIDKGGPYLSSRDDTVFMNREGRLPSQPRGYWREYTVPTPGSADRGARRIVRGKAGETYYTGDHYRTFKRIDRGSR